MVLHKHKKNLPVTVVGFSALLLASVLLADTGYSSLGSDQLQLNYQVSNTALTPGATVAVELDGYDLSAYSQVVDGNLSIDLQSPLTPGDHQLVVLLFLPNGDIEQLLDQRVVVTQASGRVSEWQSNGSLSGQYRIDQKENIDYQGVKHLSGNGGMTLRGTEQRGSWTLQTEIDAIYDSISENSFDNDEWALPHYLLSAGYQGDALTSQLSLGNIMIDREDLLFSAFQRRGASASLAANEGAFAISLFGIQPEPSTRYDGDLFVPKSSDEGSTGITATVALLEQYLQVSAAYIDGETRLGGGGFSDFEQATIYGGDSWNIALDSIWLASSLSLHIEYAESEFDSDGLNMGLDAETDSASQAMLQINSDGELSPGWFDYWSSYLQYQSVGADYYSLGNLSIPGDLEMTRLGVQGGVYGVSFDMEWSEEENNLDDELFLPTQTLERKGLTLNYSPMNINSDSGLWAAIGAPSLMASFYRTDHSQPQQDAQRVGYDLDNRNEETSLTLMFSRPTWNWSIQHQLIELDDQSEAIIQSGYVMYQPPSDTENTLTALQLGWIPNERASVNVMMQWSKQSETDFDNDYRNRNYGVDAYVQIIPETLSLLVNYNLGLDSSSLSDSAFIEDDFKSDFGNLQITWHALQAYDNSPGLDIFFRSSYGKQDNRAFNQVSEQWAVHLGVEIQWAAGGQ